MAGLVGYAPVVKENLDELGVLNGDNILFHAASKRQKVCEILAHGFLLVDRKSVFHEISIGITQSP